VLVPRPQASEPFIEVHKLEVRAAVGEITGVDKDVGVRKMFGKQRAMCVSLMCSNVTTPGILVAESASGSFILPFAGVPDTASANTALLGISSGSGGSDCSGGCRGRRCSFGSLRLGQLGMFLIQVLRWALADFRGPVADVGVSAEL
jgi:hypothetical protein